MQPESQKSNPLAKKILITGGTGFIGRKLCKSLENLKSNTRILLRSKLQQSDDAALVGSEQSFGDLRDPASLELACANREVIVHLAGVSHVHDTHKPHAQRIIVEGTRNLLNAALRQKVTRIVYLSSSLAEAAAIGTDDVTAYGKYKHAAEELLLDAHDKGLIEVVILRPVNVYGPGMQGNIAGMISLIARNRLPPLPALRNSISLVGVSDLVRVIHLAIESAEAMGNTYTVTDGHTYKINEIERAIYTALGKRFPGWRTPRMVLFTAALSAEILSRLGPNRSAIGLRTYRNITRDNLFDNTAICRDLGFQPQSGFYQELPLIVENILQKIQK